jgi:hypothetical protein
LVISAKTMLKRFTCILVWVALTLAATQQVQSAQCVDFQQLTTRAFSPPAVIDAFTFMTFTFDGRPTPKILISDLNGEEFNGHAHGLITPGKVTMFLPQATRKITVDIVFRKSTSISVQLETFGTSAAPLGTDSSDMSPATLTVSSNDDFISQAILTVPSQLGLLRMVCTEQ